MGNCFSLKHKKKEVGRDHPTVSKWLASCDFSSVPDIEDFIAEDPPENYVIYDSVLGGAHVEGECDGYITAVENIESEEDEGSGDVIDQAASSSSAGNLQNNDLYVLPDEESVYETSDEQGPCDVVEFTVTPQPANDKAEWDEEDDDVVEELTEYKTNYDARPIRPMPTPLRKNLVSPQVKLESLVDRKGRVRRSERVQLYLDEKRNLAQRL